MKTQSSTKTFTQTIREIMNDTHIRCIDDLKSQYKGYWFTKGAMAFFNSRVSSDIYHSTKEKGTIYFISSERRDHSTPRLYTVRKYNMRTHDIDSEGGFQAYTYLGAAKTAARKLQ